MKQRIFNRGKGWYIPCKNYSNQEDTCVLWVNFMRDTEPVYQPKADSDFVFMDIIIDEAKINCKDKKVSNIFVFKYRVIEPEGKLTEVDRQNKEFAEQVRGTPYEKNFGGVSNPIAPDDLPFY